MDVNCSAVKQTNFSKYKQLTKKGITLMTDPEIEIEDQGIKLRQRKLVTKPNDFTYSLSMLKTMVVHDREHFIT